MITITEKDKKKLLDLCGDDVKEAFEEFLNKNKV